MDKREMTERQRQEDIALHKVLYWMGGAAILVILLRWMRGAYVDHDRGPAAILLAWNLGRMLPFLLAGGVLFAAAAFIWGARWKKAGRETLFPFALGGFFLGFSLCVLGIWAYAGVGIQLMTYLVIGMCILAMVYYLYQRDFVAVALACGLGLIGLWLFFREGGTTRLYVVMVLLVVLLAAIAVFARYLQQHGGTLIVKGNKVEVFTKGVSYAMIYVSCALMAVALIAALVSGGALNHMVYYAVPVAWLLIMAVYYTVKLM